VDKDRARALVVRSLVERYQARDPWRVCEEGGNSQGNGAGALLSLFNAAQLERQYGGTAPNLDLPGDFPFRFYPGPFSALPEAAQAETEFMQAGIATAAQDETIENAEFDLTRLHEISGVETHEGRLWARGDEASWLPFVSGSLITRASAAYLEAEFHTTVAATETLPELLTKLATRNRAFRTLSIGSATRSSWNFTIADEDQEDQEEEVEAAISPAKNQGTPLISCKLLATGTLSPSGDTEEAPALPVSQLPVLLGTAYGQRDDETAQQYDAFVKDFAENTRAPTDSVNDADAEAAPEHAKRERTAIQREHRAAVQEIGALHENRVQESAAPVARLTACGCFMKPKRWRK